MIVDIIKPRDLNALQQREKTFYMKAEMLNENYETIGEISGAIISGNNSITADSDIRRTYSLEVCLGKDDVEFTEQILFCCYLRIYIGYYAFRQEDILYYKAGIYAFDQTSSVYNSVTHTLSITLSDQMILMDADHRGTMYGSLNEVVRATDELTGERLPRENLILKNIVVGMLEDFGVSDYIVQDIYNIAATSADDGEADELPYDLEFSKGVGLLEVLSTIKNLYDFYEMFYDVNGVFRFQQIPTCEDDPCVLDELVVNPLVVSESCTRAVYDVKNVIEVWGKDLYADRFVSNDTDNAKIGKVTHSKKVINNVSSDIYSLTLPTFEEKDYIDGLLIGVKIPTGCGNTEEQTYIEINDLTSRKAVYKPINANDIQYELDDDGNVVIDPITGKKKLKEGSLSFIEPGELTDDTVYVFKYNAGINVNGFYLLGVYQVHALTVLTNGDLSQYEGNTDEEKRQTRENIFKQEYNVRKVSFQEDPYSPYTIEKIGKIHYIPDDSTYENIDSDDSALSAAEYVLWQKARRTDTLSLEMILVPWLDVNQKIKYIKAGETEAKQYIVKSISSNFGSGTMDIEVMRFYNYFK